jgi:hypothetical protein
MRECYDDDDDQRQKHGNFEISFKLSYRSLALPVADILSCFCEERAFSLQSCSTPTKRGRQIIIQKLSFTRKQQENHARGEHDKNVI